MQGLVDFLVVFATDLLIPIMAMAFCLALMAKFVVFLTVRRIEWFSWEFEKRVHNFLHRDNPGDEDSFYIITKKLLEKTYYEIFEIRRVMNRRKPDQIMTLADRLFLIQHGVAKFVIDVLNRIRHLKHNRDPKLLDVSKQTLGRNPCFNNVFAIIPSGPINDFLKILPGLFIVGGIFGTFLGIMAALPELGNIDLNDIEGSKAVMDEFLTRIAYSMSTSILGIFMSATMTVINALFSPEKVYFTSVNRIHDSLLLIWDYSTTNTLPAQNPKFNLNRDPLEVLAEEVVIKNSVFGKKQYQRVEDTDNPNRENRSNQNESNNDDDKIDKAS